MGHMTVNRYRVSFREWWKWSKLENMNMNILKTNGSYTLKGWILWYVNCISIKLLFFFFLVYSRNLFKSKIWTRVREQSKIWIGRQEGRETVPSKENHMNWGSTVEIYMAYSRNKLVHWLDQYACIRK